MEEMFMKGYLLFLYGYFSLHIRSIYNVLRATQSTYFMVIIK